MAQQKDDLTLGTGLIRKGEARGLSPALASPARPEEPVAVATALEQPAPVPPQPPAAPPTPVPVTAVPTPLAMTTTPQLNDDPDPPLRAAPPDDVAKRFTSFRLPVSLDEDLRAMMFETRRSKQDLLIEFVTEGVKAWRRSRVLRT